MDFGGMVQFSSAPDVRGVNATGDISRLASKVRLTISDALSASINFASVINKRAKADLDAKASLKKIKPWEKQRDKPSSVRQELTNITSLETRIEFKPAVAPRIGLRLENTMLYPNVKLDDRAYLKELLEKIKARDQVIVEKRVVQRRKVEVKRTHQLVIDGKADPGPGQEHLLGHPILRMRKVMDRVTRSDARNAVLTPQVKAKHIGIVEPFEDFERTGLLFGHHKNHYLRPKQKRRTRVRKSGESITESGSGDLSAPLVIEPVKPLGKKKSSDIFETARIFDSLRPQTARDVRDIALKAKGTKLRPQTAPSALEVEEELGEGEEEETPVRGDSLKNFSSHTPFLNVDDDDGSDKGGSDDAQPDKSQPDLEALEKDQSEETTEKQDSTTSKPRCSKSASGFLKKHFDHISFSELEKMYAITRSQLIDELYKEENEHADSLWDVGNSVIRTYLREQSVSSNFANKKLRKIMDRV